MPDLVCVGYCCSYVRQILDPFFSVSAFFSPFLRSVAPSVRWATSTPPAANVCRVRRVSSATPPAFTAPAILLCTMTQLSVRLMNKIRRKKINSNLFISLGLCRQFGVDAVLERVLRTVPAHQQQHSSGDGWCLGQPLSAAAAVQRAHLFLLLGQSHAGGAQPYGQLRPLLFALYPFACLRLTCLYVRVWCSNT
jgi:hypothetical protein